MGSIPTPGIQKPHESGLSSLANAPRVSPLIEGSLLEMPTQTVYKSGWYVHPTAARMREVLAIGPFGA